MDINDFLPKKLEPIPVIQKDADSAKYDAVAAKLCEKRKIMETTLKEGELPKEQREELALELMRLRESMKTFGITEIDYQAYLAFKEKEGGIQLELF